MILTYKIKHQFKLEDELQKARLVAEFAVKNKDKLSSKNVKAIGLKSAISNQILRKYGRNKKCKSITKVNLIVANQSLKIKNNILKLVPLKLELNISHLPKFIKVCQVELSKEFAFVSVEIAEAIVFQPETYVGLDRNATGHIAVLANPSNGKVLKLGKECSHIRNKYRNLRKLAQKRGVYNFVKKLGKRENNIVRDINHKIAKTIIQYCLVNKVGLVLENLKGIRKQKSKGKKFNGMLSSWSFNQLEQFLIYKALRYGITIAKIDAAYTSQQCSKCAHLGERNGKHFTCHNCEHTDHADVNAAFNIAKRHLYGWSLIDRDINESINISTNFVDMNPDNAQSGNVRKVS
jgi:putative transposase